MHLKEGLIRIVRHLGVHFTLNGRAISYEEVFSDIGLLPALAKRADQLCSLCLGYGIGVTFSEAGDSKLGIKSIFDDATPHTLRYLCLTDVLYELIRSAPSSAQVPLDALMYD